VLDAYYQLGSGFTMDEPDALFHGTADRVFALA
jgi:hypothetical protein